MKTKHRPYRGKRIDGGGWAYGYYVADIEWAKYYIYYPKQIGAYIQLVRIEVDPATVGQYFDHSKDDAAIYKGDYLTDYSSVDEHGIPFKGLVGFEKGAFRFIETNCNCGECLGQVIETGSEYNITSNIHDNPDLLTTQTTTDG